MTVGTLKFKQDTRLTVEPTLGNERVMRFSKNKVYTVALDTEKMKRQFVDIHFIHKAWASGVNPELFTFTPDKRLKFKQ